MKNQVTENTSPQESLFIGVITSVKGVKGHVKIRVFTENIEDIFNFSEVFDESGKTLLIKPISVKKDLSKKASHGSVVASVDGIENRDQATTIINTKLYIKRSELPEISEDEYYHSDLIGLDVFYSDGAMLGNIADIYNFGAGDVLEIYDISSGKTIFYPFIKQFVNEVSIQNKKVVVEHLEEVIDSANE